MFIFSLFPLLSGYVFTDSAPLGLHTVRQKKSSLSANMYAAPWDICCVYPSSVQVGELIAVCHGLLLSQTSKVPFHGKQDIREKGGKQGTMWPCPDVELWHDGEQLTS